MDQSSLYIRHSLSLAIFALASAISYFAYAILAFVAELPAIEQKAELVSVSVTKAVEELGYLETLIPAILLESEAIRQQVPAILLEVKSVREQVPLIVNEVNILQTQIPEILQELEAIREQVPAVLAELEELRRAVPPVLDELRNYRESVLPHVLAESIEIRKVIPLALERMEKIIDQASVTGKEASEGAVAGFFSGIIKAPVSLAKDFGSGLFGDKIISYKDRKMISKKSTQLLNTGKVGDEISYSNAKTGIAGSILLLRESAVDGRYCRVLQLNFSKLGESTKTACLNANKKWEFAPNQ